MLNIDDMRKMARFLINMELSDLYFILKGKPFEHIMQDEKNWFINEYEYFLGINSILLINKLDDNNLSKIMDYINNTKG